MWLRMVGNPPSKTCLSTSLPYSYPPKDFPLTLSKIPSLTMTYKVLHHLLSSPQHPLPLGFHLLFTHTKAMTLTFLLYPKHINLTKCSEHCTSHDLAWKSPPSAFCRIVSFTSALPLLRYCFSVRSSLTTPFQIATPQKYSPSLSSASFSSFAFTRI